jgi:hypothetical protein
MENHPQGRGPHAALKRSASQNTGGDGLEDAGRPDSAEAKEDHRVETVEDAYGQAAESDGSSKGIPGAGPVGA